MLISERRPCIVLRRCPWMGSKSQLTILLVSVSLALVGAVAVTGILTTSRTVGSSGTVKAINVEVYWDLGCTQVVDQIDWGILEPGDTPTKTVYVKNTGNAALTLSMTYSGWDPTEAGSYITLSWDKEGATVDSDGVTGAVLTLSVSDSISGITMFSFNITIEGTG